MSLAPRTGTLWTAKRGERKREEGLCGWHEMMQGRCEMPEPQGLPLSLPCAGNCAAAEGTGRTSTFQ